MKTFFANLNKKLLIIPLVIIIVLTIVVSWNNFQARPVVTESFPKNGSIETLSSPNIYLVFGNNLTQKDKDNLTVKINPDISVELRWNEKKLSIIPLTPLNPGTSYIITIDFKGKEIYKYSFTNGLFTLNQIKTEGTQQSYDDMAFGEELKKFLTQYPWYQSLPIEKEQYRIVYDFEKKQFRIRFKIKPQDNIQEKDFIDAAVADLKRIGVTEPIPYYIITE